MDTYSVTGMSCAACSARVEKAVSKVPGVRSCSVNLLTHSMVVDGAAREDAIISAVKNAGYGASLKAGETAKAAPSPLSDLDDKETPILRKRLLWSVLFLAALMYLSMGHRMWNWPLPPFLSENPVSAGLMELILAAVVMTINQKFFINGFQAVLHRAPNMDTLVAMGSGASFLYSAYSLFAALHAQSLGNTETFYAHIHDLYFESAAMIVTLITVGKMLEARAKGKTTNALKSLLSLSPKTAKVLRDGNEIEISAEEVLVGDIFVVYPGESIPVDGIVTEGMSAVNEAALTGESIPVDKSANDSVSAGTINQSGFLECRATRVGKDTALSKIIKLVENATATKAPIAKIADKVSGVFVPIVIGIAALSAAVWLLAGESAGFSFSRAIAVLVISCPCALGLATPVAIMVGSGVGAKCGIMFKTAVSLETTGKTQIAVLDKTGTLTSGAPNVTDIIPADGVEENTLLSLAYSLESKSEHPLAKAVTEFAMERGIPKTDVSDFEALPGNGLFALLKGEKLFGGNQEFLQKSVSLPPELTKAAKSLAAEGKTPMFFAKGDLPLGVIAVADVIREDSKKAVEELKNLGITVYMLTGDNERTAKAVADAAGITHVMASLMPEGKEKAVRELKKQGNVLMVGDGINDAPALALADIGIAIGGGTDIAADSADIVLLKNHLRDVPAAIRLSRATLKNIRENLFWAFIYNIIGIPLAAGVWIPLFGLKLNPMFGAAAMSLSSFSVVVNALRLNFCKIYDDKKDKRIKHKNRKKETLIAMKKTLSIEGMMCEHCEARVKKALEGIDGVESAKVSHKDGTATVTLSHEIPDELLKGAVEDQDYQVIGIE